MAHHVPVRKPHHGDAVDILQRLHRIGQARARSGGQVNLTEVAGHHHARALAQPSQKHLHLLAGGVLGLVEDDEGVVQGAAAHEGQRRHLDIAAGQPFDHLVAGQHVVERVVERPEIGIDLLADVAGQEAEPLAGLDRGTRQDDAVDLAGLQQRHRRRHRQVCLAGARGAKAENQFVGPHGVDIGRLGRRPRCDPPAPGLDHLARPADAAARRVGSQLAGLGQADDGVDLALVGRRTILDSLIQGQQGIARGRHRRGFAADRYFVAARMDCNAEIVLDAHQVAVVLAEQQGKHRIVLELQGQRAAAVTTAARSAAAARGFRAAR